jgi:broad specificity phosphatase PhoE
MSLAPAPGPTASPEVPARARRTRRLLLVRHAATAATRAAGFPLDEPLDERGHAAAVALAPSFTRVREALCSPALRCRQTAAAAELPAQVEPAIAECDFGTWAGRTLADVHGSDPEGAVAWMTDPGACPHGGESLTDLEARVGRWLDAQAEGDGRAVAVTHAGVIRVAVVRALGAPIESFWRIDVAPLTVTELHARDGRWTVTRVNAPVGEPA